MKGIALPFEAESGSLGNPTFDSVPLPIQANMRPLPFATEFFDVIVSTDSSFATEPTIYTRLTWL